MRVVLTLSRTASNGPSGQNLHDVDNHSWCIVQCKQNASDINFQVHVDFKKLQWSQSNPMCKKPYGHFEPAVSYT